MTSGILIYLIGGPMRCGKSQAARLFNARTGISYISSDDLCAMLGLAAPQLKIGWDAGNTWQENRRLLAPFIRELAAVRLRDQEPLLIEGELQPEVVAEVIAADPNRIRACFIGAARLSVGAKLAALRDWSAAKGDWLSGAADSEFEWAATESLNASRAYHEAAVRSGIPYFDLSDDFSGGLEAVVHYLETGAAK